MRVLAVTPIHLPDDEIRRRRARYARLAPAGLDIELRDVGPSAPTALDTADAVRASEERVGAAFAAARAAEPARWDALLPDCVLDPGVPGVSSGAPAGAGAAGGPPMRGLLKLSATYLAATGTRFGAVVRNDAIAAELDNRLRAYGLTDHVAGIRVLELPFEAIADTAAWNAALSGAVRRLAERGAGVVLNGCSAVDVEPARLPARVVDPTALALRLLAIEPEILGSGTVGSGTAGRESRA